MGTIHLITTEREYDISTEAGESLLECLRRSNIPVQACLLLDERRNYVSLSNALGIEDEVWAFSLRNPDFEVLQPDLAICPVQGAVTEIIRPLNSPKKLALFQFTRPQAIEYIYGSFREALNSYSRNSGEEMQVALSSGGDARILAECVGRYSEEYPSVRFHCVIMAAGFEDEEEHLTTATRIAEQFGLAFTAYTGRDVADVLGMRGDVNEVMDAFRRDFPTDEMEVLGTYWIQQFNFAVARKAGRRAIILGYNQEDVIADRIYHLMVGRLLPPYPVRQLENEYIVAPLFQIPKKLLDSLDIDNSIKNYNRRRPSVSYLRSSLYFLSYLICEKFPAIADVISGAPLEGEDPDMILRWMQTQ